MGVQHARQQMRTASAFRSSFFLSFRSPLAQLVNGFLARVREILADLQRNSGCEPSDLGRTFRGLSDVLGGGLWEKEDATFCIALISYGLAITLSVEMGVNFERNQEMSLNHPSYFACGACKTVTCSCGCSRSTGLHVTGPDELTVSCMHL